VKNFARDRIEVKGEFTRQQPPTAFHILKATRDVDADNTKKETIDAFATARVNFALACKVHRARAVRRAAQGTKLLCAEFNWLRGRTSHRGNDGGGKQGHNHGHCDGGKKRSKADTRQERERRHGEFL
jgi:hypothetical protein